MLVAGAEAPSRRHAPSWQIDHGGDRRFTSVHIDNRSEQK